MILCANPSAQYRSHKAAIRQAVNRVLESSSYILGKEVSDFEAAFAAYCGAGHAAGVGNGTDALVLVLRAFGIGRGDEVITVSHTALATVAAVIATGATPVLVDIDPVTYTIDPAAVEKAVTKRTKAIIAVHLYGQSADLDALKPIARHHKLKLIEDCAQATGGLYKGKRLGSIGDAGTFSFYPTKNLGAIGDGGMVVSNDRKLIERIAQQRQYGWNAKRETKEPGLNSRLDPLQAAILAAKLPNLDTDNGKRIKLAGIYGKALRDLPLTLPAVRADSRHVYHLYVISCRDRDALRQSLKKSGIDGAIHYPVPAHRHGGYADVVKLPRRGLPVTDHLIGQIISLPLYPELKRADVDAVIAAIHSHYGA